MKRSGNAVFSIVYLSKRKQIIEAPLIGRKAFKSDCCEGGEAI